MKKESIINWSEACNNSLRYTRSLRINSSDKCVKTHHLRRWNSIHHENSGLICSCHAQRIHRIFKVDNSDQMLPFTVTRPLPFKKCRMELRLATQSSGLGSSMEGGCRFQSVS